MNCSTGRLRDVSQDEVFIENIALIDRSESSFFFIRSGGSQSQSRHVLAWLQRETQFQDFDQDCAVQGLYCSSLLSCRASEFSLVWCELQATLSVESAEFLVFSKYSVLRPPLTTR